MRPPSCCCTVLCVRDVVCVQINYLLSCSSLLIKAKRLELKHKARLRKQEEAAAGGGGQGGKQQAGGGSGKGGGKKDR